jgi:DNA-binding response OmpR family regulator
VTSPQQITTFPDGVGRRPDSLNDEQSGGDRSVAGEEVRFGRFWVIPGARQLFVDGRTVEVGSRAFDLLVVLLSARGTVVNKREIIDRVWPSTVVDESNLRFQMAALRRALGEYRDVIKTVPGRGYLFAVDVLAGPAERSDFMAPYIASTVSPASGSDPHASGKSDPLRSTPQPDDAIVVVIDDDSDIRDALRGLLRSAGLRVELFASVQDFQDHMSPTRPACLILDVWLPGKSGLDFQAELARADVRLPVIFISGHADVPMSVRAMKAGAVEFLTKPVRHEDLLDAIRRAMNKNA